MRPHRDFLTFSDFTKPEFDAIFTTVGGTDAIQVTITYPVGSLTGFLRAVMPANAVATAVMRWQ